MAADARMEHTPTHHMGKGVVTTDRKEWWPRAREDRRFQNEELTVQCKHPLDLRALDICQVPPELGCVGRRRKQET